MGEHLAKLKQIKAIYWFTWALAIALLLHWVPLNLLFDPQALMQHMQMDDRCKACIFVIAQTVATAVGLPGTLLVIAGGASFGLVWGTIWSTLGATLGAIVAFCLARYLLRGWYERRLGQHPVLKRLNQTIHENSLNCILAIRFAPISPFNLMNFLLGLTPVRLHTYAIGTFLGIIPGTFAYTGLGVSGKKALTGEGLFELVLPLVGLTLLSGLPVLAKSVWRR